jgi:hypothetical protein
MTQPQRQVRQVAWLLMSLSWLLPPSAAHAQATLTWSAGQEPGGQSSQQAAKRGGPIPRTPEGKPDLQGFWQARALDTPNMNQGLEENPASFQNPGGTSRISDPPDGLIPYQPWAKAERDLRRLPESSYDDPEVHCFLAGVPRQMFINIHQILQTPAAIQILFEFAHAQRIIHLDGRPHLPSGIRLWQGDSVGQWEGDTLVVETTNNNGATWLEQTGNFVSDAARQLERFTMIDADTISYQVTITDPKALTRPFTMGFPIVRIGDGNFQLLEYACLEGNLDLPHLKAVQDAGGGRPKRPAPASRMPTSN